MSTRSYIVIEKKRKSGEYYYEGVYCHSDGYPSYNGQILFNHYKDRSKVEKLISLGDLSSLGERIEPTEGSGHNFEYSEREPGVCVFYNRDRGEDGVGPEEVKLEDLASDVCIEYTYIYTLRDEWLCFAYSYLDRIARLADVLKNENILYPEDES
jgi:hypothetical protein